MGKHEWDHKDPFKTSRIYSFKKAINYSYISMYKYQKEYKVRAMSDGMRRSYK